MANIKELLADSLEVLRQLQTENPNIILRSTQEISRTHLNRLLANGWLQELMRGWYIPSRPGYDDGDISDFTSLIYNLVSNPT